MHKLIRWYNQNRVQAWIGILAFVVIALILGGFVGTIAENMKEEEKPQKININNELKTITMSSDKSAISGSEIDVDKNYIHAIDSFIEYCNSGKIEDAYKLISNECKEELYPNIKAFKNLYYNPVFEKGNRTVSIENWTGDIYKVKLGEDLMATGKISGGKDLQDYITIVEDSQGNPKLNINGYIGRFEVNSTEKANNIEITITEKDVYMDYEIYTFKVNNTTNGTIALGNVNYPEYFSYVEDKNDFKYYAKSNELAQGEVEINPKQTKTIRVKYDNRYISTRKIERLTILGVIIDYDKYLMAEYKKITYSPTTAKFEFSI